MGYVTFTDGKQKKKKKINLQWKPHAVVENSKEGKLNNQLSHMLWSPLLTSPSYFFLFFLILFVPFLLIYTPSYMSIFEHILFKETQSPHKKRKRSLNILA